MRKPVLEVRGLKIVREGRTILQPLDWQINAGEHWVILGPNGSGKTSLLSSMTGYFPPTEGEITVLQQVYGDSDWRKLRLKVGIVSSSVRQFFAETEPALFTVASGKYGMIDFWGTPKKQDRLAAMEILKQIECEHLAKSSWAWLSQGERQRILIGRALMAHPALLILDEPCAGLDPISREKFLAFLQKLGQRASPALILTTHHVEEIMPVFSHALMLREGYEVAKGPLKSTLTSRNLTKTFAHEVKLKRSRRSFSLKVQPVSGREIL